VADILQKGMLGERDALKELGISITDNDVKQQLLKDGTDKLTGAALEQAKAHATLELYMAKTTDAQDAYAKGTAVGIRRQHEMDAQLQTVKETLAKALYPILTKVGGFIAENLPQAIKFLGEAWTNVGPIKAVWPVVSTVAGNIKNAFVTVAQIIRAAINGVIDIVNTVIRGINSIQVHVHVGPINYDFDGVNLGYLPKFHAGGVVPGVVGTEVPALLQAGERVTPINGGAPGVQVVVNGNVYGVSGVDELSDLIAERLRLAGA
jgi:hypothetical protein